MPRKRTESVTESLATLAALREQYRGKPQDDRLRVLYLLKEDPSRTLEEVSSEVGCSERTVRRWWSAYKIGGLDAVLDVQQGGGGKPARIADEEIAGLVERLKSQGISDVRDVQRWLKDELGLDYSLSGVRYLMRNKLKMGDDEKDVAVEVPKVEDAERTYGMSTNGTAAGGGLVLNDALVNFLNAFPMVNDVNVWLEQFRNNLLKILPDVDRIVVNVDVACDLSDSRSIARNIVVLRQHASGDAESVSVTSESVDVQSRANEADPVGSVIEYLRRDSFPFEKYHAPRAFNYWLEAGRYLGSILLFRDRHTVPTSTRTYELFNALSPFIMFMLSDSVARHQRVKPMDLAFKDAMQRMMAESGLSIQEQRVVFLQLLGCSYKESADLLRVSLNTIRHHLKSIHAKTNTRSQSELFAKYFTPLLPTLGAEEGR
jgi:DNA-binding CsgD family transcriptional regulator